MKNSTDNPCCFLLPALLYELYQFLMKYVPYPMTTIMVTSVFRKSRMPMAITPIYDHCTIQGQRHGHTCHGSKSGFCVFRML